MTRGIIASLIRFTKGASPLEFNFHYCGIEAGVVKRVCQTGNHQWQIEDEPHCTGATREEAVTKFLRADLTVVLPPVSTSNVLVASLGD